MSLKITQELFSALRNGDEHVFDLIMEVNAPKVYAFIRKMLKSKMDAEELTQDVFVALWQNKTNIQTPEAFYGYLFTIARNITLNHIKSNTLTRIDLEKIIPYRGKNPKVLDSYKSKELYLKIELEINKMPPQRQKVFRMSRKEGLTHAQIAQSLGISQHTVSNHISAALTQLKELF